MRPSSRWRESGTAVGQWSDTYRCECKQFPSGDWWETVALWGSFAFSATYWVCRKMCALLGQSSYLFGCIVVLQLIAKCGKAASPVMLNIKIAPHFCRQFIALFTWLWILFACNFAVEERTLSCIIEQQLSRPSISQNWSRDFEPRAELLRGERKNSVAS